jgi:hypothetical protein
MAGESRALGSGVVDAGENGQRDKRVVGSIFHSFCF